MGFQLSNHRANLKHHLHSIGAAMIDPTDRQLEVYREGDADITPGQPTGGPFGEIPESNVHSWPGLPPKIWRVFNESLIAGDQITRDVGDRPEYWLVSMDDTASAEIRLNALEVPAGPFVAIGPNGYAAFPGESNYLTVTNPSAVTATFTAIAVRGHLVMCEVRYGG